MASALEPFEANERYIHRIELDVSLPKIPSSSVHKFSRLKTYGTSRFRHEVVSELFQKHFERPIVDFRGQVERLRTLIRCSKLFGLAFGTRNFSYSTEDGRDEGE
jgi:hypothetical protein